MLTSTLEPPHAVAHSGIYTLSHPTLRIASLDLLPRSRRVPQNHVTEPAASDAARVASPRPRPVVHADQLISWWRLGRTSSGHRARWPSTRNCEPQAEGLQHPDSVPSRGFPSLDSARYNDCRPTPLASAMAVMPRARATSPIALAKNAGSCSSQGTA